MANKLPGNAEAFRWDDPNLEIKLAGRNVRPADLAMIMGHKGEKFTVFARPDFFGETYRLDFEGNGGARAGNAAMSRCHWCDEGRPFLSGTNKQHIPILYGGEHSGAMCYKSPIYGEEGSVSQPSPSAPDAMKMGSPENGQES